MHVVTFYSFKGGAGRSMSLVNVGVQLAQSGKKVLLVDFDLEAPGLPLFELEKPESKSNGIVDYVLNYLNAGEAPDIDGYIYKSTQFGDRGGIWVMPVGREDVDYSHRLNSINWHGLYEEHDGYLLFENLKRQWETSLNPDYVLIDSRTGHSDVEGICTRQLPDAVCLVFLPTEPNLQGLKAIVGNIRDENERSYRKNIALHFVVSNVPELDDEEKILERTMARFSEELDYEKLAARIDHYNSLSLLTGEVFSITRPNSRLTAQYKKLTRAITHENLADRDAVIELLKTAGFSIVEGEVSFPAPEIAEKLPQILSNFPADGEVIFRAARVYDYLGENVEALSLLTNEAVEKTYSVAPMYALRAQLQQILGNPESAVQDLQLLLDAPEASIETFSSATPLMERIAPQLFSQLPTSRAFQSLPIPARHLVADRLDESAAQTAARLEILRQLADQRLDQKVANRAMDELPLTAISLGEFDLAIEVLTKIQTPEYMTIQTVFNLAMAKWGKDHQPPIELFRRVIELDTPSNHIEGSNYLQCLGLAHAVVGDADKSRSFLNEAKRRIERRAGRHFSAWVYARVDAKQFIEHLEAIERLLIDRELLPEFISRHDSLGITSAQ